MAVEFEEEKDKFNFHLLGRNVADFKSTESEAVGFLMALTGGRIKTERTAVLIIGVIFLILFIGAFYFLFTRNNVNIPPTMRAHNNGKDLPLPTHP